MPCQADNEAFPPALWPSVEIWGHGSLVIGFAEAEEYNHTLLAQPEPFSFGLQVQAAG